MRRGRSLTILFVCLLSAATASAQDEAKEPIGRVSVDLRFAFARHKVEPVIADALGLLPANLPKRTMGLAGGGQFYFWHFGGVAIGGGANFIMAKGNKTLETTATGSTEVTKSPEAIRHFSTLSPEISINFGHKRGWSYISGGMFGRSKLYVERADAPVSGMSQRKTINYGAGAKWFAKEHLAFSVDVRWYTIRDANPPDVLQPATTVMVLTGGISIK